MLELQTNNLQNPNLGKINQWIKALQINRKVPDSNPTKCSARFRDPPLLQGSQRHSGRKLNKRSD